MTTTLTAVPYPNTQTVRTNLCPNPSFETNVTGWAAAGSGGALARVVGTARYGTAYASTTATAAGECRIVQTSGLAVVAAGQVWTLSAWVRGTVGRSVAMRAAYQPSNATVLGPAVVMTGDWQRVTLTVTVPASQTALSAAVVMDAAGVVAGAFLDVDGVLVEQAPAAGDYFDGSMASGLGLRYAWTGTPHASASTRTTRVPTGAATVVTPLLAMNRQDEREGVVTVHRILGTDRTVITVGARPSALRTGTFELLCASLAAADALAEVLRAGTVMVVDTDEPSLSMYAVCARVRTTPGAQGTARAVVSCDYYETGIEGDNW